MRIHPAVLILEVGNRPADGKPKNPAQLVGGDISISRGVPLPASDMRDALRLVQADIAVAQRSHRLAALDDVGGLPRHHVQQA